MLGRILKISFKFFQVAVVTLLLFFIILIVYNSSRGISEYQELSYTDLPVDVQKALKTRQHSLVEQLVFSCINLKSGCNCEMANYTRVPLSEGLLKLQSCNETVEIDFSLTAFRFFILNNGNVYFPILSAFSYDSNAKFSEVLELKTARFGRIEL